MHDRWTYFGIFKTKKNVLDYNVLDKIYIEFAKRIKKKLMSNGLASLSSSY